MKKSLICVPTYNERDNIGRLIERLLKLREDIDILVIDDSSQDGTADVVKSFAETKRVHLLSRKTKNGIGPAYIAGFKWGLARDYDYIFEMDADLSHRPRYINQFLKSIQNSDLVIGSRWMKGGRIAKWPLNRVLLSRYANVYSKFVLGVPVRDLTTGFVCYRREVLKKINLDRIHSDGYSFQIEMKFRAFQNGFKLREIPITFTDRKVGRSKINRGIFFEALFMVWVLRISDLFGRTNSL